MSLSVQEELHLKDNANQLRILAMTATTKAGSGHPSSCLSCAEIMSALFFSVMHYDPKHMDAYDNDQFILSKGHAAPILYAALTHAGILTQEELFTLRKFTSRIEGHPTPNIPGVRIATGSLGQGLSAGVGMALAMRLDQIKRKVYVLLGDGEMAEGSVWEAMNSASKEKLNNITAILDMNRLGQSGPTKHGWESDVYKQKAEAFGWHPIVVDGHSIKEVHHALIQVHDKPVFIIAKTMKGKGVSVMENKENYHGKPLTQDELALALKEIPRPQESQSKQNPKAQNEITTKLFNNPKKQLSLTTTYKKGEMVATREAYGKALVKLGEQDPSVVVVDGDVGNSTYTEYFFKKFPERSFQSFIAEQNMIGMCTGLQAQGKRVFTATFAAFLARAYDQIRMGIYSHADLKIAGSHAGVSIGEDGPSQMGLEDLAIMRALLGSVVLYPSDGVSAEKVVATAANYHGISYIRTSRPKTPVLYENFEEFPIGGSKTLRSTDHDAITLIGSGVTLHEALAAADEIKKEGINVRVIDCYSIKPIDSKALIKAAKDTKEIITIEDHYHEGGLGEAVASALCTSKKDVHIHILAVTKMPHSGSPAELLAEQSIDKKGIIKKVHEVLTHAKKNKPKESRLSH